MLSRKKAIVSLILLMIFSVLTTSCSNPIPTSTTSPSTSPTPTLTTTTTTSPITTTTPSVTVTTGDHIGSLYWDGVNRTYIIHLPPADKQMEPMPLVFCLHGAGGDAEQTVKFTHGGFNTLADKDGFVVVYPSAVDGKWNDHRDPNFSQTDDVGFFTELIKQLSATYNIDGKRIYVTGISNGSHMTMCLAHELSEKFAAVAAVAYGMSEKEAAQPIATVPISVLVMTGTQDPLVPWQGGETYDMEGERMLGPILSVPDAVALIAAFNQCSSTPTITWIPDNDPTDGTRVLITTYSGGNQGTEVVLYAIIGGGHSWPVGWQYPVTVIGKTCRDIDANEVIWEFFKKHSR